MKHPATIREAIEAQRERLKSGDPRRSVVEAFFRCGELSGRLRDMSDKQVGQLVFDVVIDDVPLVNPAMSVAVEASERLFRSPAGARATHEVFNDPDMLPRCPRCHHPMMHFIGIDEPDYQECVALDCGYKIEEHRNR
jgi:hypothetical protein